MSKNMYRCSGCLQLVEHPALMMNITPETLFTVSFDKYGRKSINTMGFLGQHMLCSTRCASLLMIDLLTKKEQGEEE